MDEIKANSILSHLPAFYPIFALSLVAQSTFSICKEIQFWIEIISTNSCAENWKNTTRRVRKKGIWVLLFYYSPQPLSIHELCIFQRLLENWLNSSTLEYEKKVSGFKEAKDQVKWPKRFSKGVRKRPLRQENQTFWQGIKTGAKFGSKNTI